jgi:hypothetical protein
VFTEPEVKIDERDPNVLADETFCKEQSFSVYKKIRRLIEVLIKRRLDVCLCRRPVLNDDGLPLPAVGRLVS